MKKVERCIRKKKYEDAEEILDQLDEYIDQDLVTKQITQSEKTIAEKRLNGEFSVQDQEEAKTAYMDILKKYVSKEEDMNDLYVQEALYTIKAINDNTRGLPNNKYLEELHTIQQQTAVQRFKMGSQAENALIQRLESILAKDSDNILFKHVTINALEELAFLPNNITDLIIDYSCKPTLLDAPGIQSELNSFGLNTLEAEIVKDNCISQLLEHGGTIHNVYNDSDSESIMGDSGESDIVDWL